MVLEKIDVPDLLAYAEMSVPLNDKIFDTGWIILQQHLRNNTDKSQDKRKALSKIPVLCGDKCQSCQDQGLFAFLKSSTHSCNIVACRCMLPRLIKQLTLSWKPNT